MLSLSRCRSDVRNVAESIAAGEQQFDGTLTATAATPGSGGAESINLVKRFCSAAAASAAAFRQRRHV